MEGAASKRKQGPGGSQGPPSKKKTKGSNGGKWTTSHHSAKNAEKIEMGTKLDVGDEGIWVTYARGMMTKAVREFKALCYEYAEIMYDIKPPDAEQVPADGKDGEEDIEASIEQELGNLKTVLRPKSRQTFTAVPAGIQCVFFMKTTKPVDPCELVLRICEDARICAHPMERKCKYINRLSPVADTDNATEKGLVRVARATLAPWFTLKSEKEGDSEEKKEPPAKTMPAYTYAIRHNIRSHDTLKSDVVIKQVAGLIDERHSVKLTNPDKVILVEIFQMHCGMSVVDGGHWERLKKYNVNEAYRLASEDWAEATEGKTDETEAPKGKTGREEAAANV